jgi:hypothetical protein
MATKRRIPGLRIALTVALAALVAVAAGMSCKKETKEKRVTKSIKQDVYAKFLTVETKPLVQENDVLDLETYISVNWEKALEELGIIERPGADLWLTLHITKMEFCDENGECVQAFDFERNDRSDLTAAIKENDTDPQVFDRIKFYRGGFSDNYGKPSVRRGEDTAIIHFPIYEELGHRLGSMKLYGYMEVPPHYEAKKGEEGIYEKVGSKIYDRGLIAAAAVDATAVDKVPLYSKRAKTVEEAEKIAEAEEKYLETVEVLADALRLRSSPDMSASTITTLKRGAKLKVIEKSGDWYKVRTEAGQLGWAKAVHEGNILLD